MRLFPIAAALTLAACGTVQSTQYFVLPDSRYIRPATQGGETAVEVRLAEPLKRGGLVYQTDPYRINTAQNHVWADTLDDMLEAALSNAFNRLD
ncbi:TPA: membrane integrity-associated transporter subunit PqiC, partial [Neisseria gonorrhoeae]